MTHKNLKNEKLSLINYEGDCLWAIHGNAGDIVVYDQWESLVDIVTPAEFLEWVDGLREFIDSEGRPWYYQEHHRDARASIQKIFNFLNRA